MGRCLGWLVVLLAVFAIRLAYRTNPWIWWSLPIAFVGVILYLRWPYIYLSWKVHGIPMLGFWNSVCNGITQQEADSLLHGIYRKYEIYNKLENVEMVSKLGREFLSTKQLIEKIGLHTHDDRAYANPLFF